MQAEREETASILHIAPQANKGLLRTLLSKKNI